MDARRVILLLLLLLPILLPEPVAPSAAGQTYIVTTLADTVAPDGHCSLREAILEAQHETDTDCPGGPSYGDDTIAITVSGTILLSSPLPDIIGRRLVIMPDLLGEDILLGALTIRGNPALTISGNGHVRIVTVKDLAVLTLDTITVTDAVAPDHGGAIVIQGAGQVTITNSRFTNCTAPIGGALVAANTRVTIEHSVFAANRASDYGGAIAVSHGQIIIRDSELTGNTAVHAGGALYLSAVRNSAIVRTIFAENEVTNIPIGHGGAIMMWSVESISVQDTVFRENAAIMGGGAMALLNVVQVDIRTSSFVANTVGSEQATGAGGGAIWAEEVVDTPLPPITITASAFVANRTRHDGGAIFVRNHAVVIAQSRFTENQAEEDGGAIEIVQDTHPGQPDAMKHTVFVIRESELTQNRAGGDGGAVFALISDGTLTVTNTAFRRNEADYHGGGNCQTRGPGTD